MSVVVGDIKRSKQVCGRKEGGTKHTHTHTMQREETAPASAQRGAHAQVRAKYTRRAAGEGAGAARSKGRLWGRARNYRRRPRALRGGTGKNYKGQRLWSVGLVEVGWGVVVGRHQLGSLSLSEPRGGVCVCAKERVLFCGA